MIDANDGLSESEIRAVVGAHSGAPLRFEILSETDSTNSHTFGRGEQGALEGLVVFAERQSAGRGRLNRAWESPGGKNIYTSLLLRPPLSPSTAPQITLVAGVACYEALRNYVGARQAAPLRLKWPNDLWVGLKKIGGILTELKASGDRVDFVVVGIGLNINADVADFSEGLLPIATSLLLETGKTHSRSQMAGGLLQSFFQNYDDFLKNGFEPIRKKWEAYSKMGGTKVKVAESGRTFEGICQGLDEEGYLLVRTSSGVEKVVAGDVSWI